MLKKLNSEPLPIVKFINSSYKLMKLQRFVCKTQKTVGGTEASCLEMIGVLYLMLLFI